MSEANLGVFICDCGGRIGSVLDMDTLARQVQDLQGTTSTQRLRYSCSPDGLAAIQSAITEQSLERVVVAGCTPRTLGPHFRNACEQVGLDGNLFELVDIREGCAWVHPDDPEAATTKAVDLIGMGIARVALRQRCHLVSTQVVPAALVIGGGLAGMNSALTLANAGIPVTLVEREAELGGMLREASLPLGKGRNAARISETVVNHPRIEVFFNSVVKDISGGVGRYTVKVNGRERQPDQPASVEVGAIVVATGGHVMQPRGLFRYDGRRVVTQLEFERELRSAERGAESLGFPSGVVMVLCAGQRDDAVPYCSGMCCVAALRQALAVKAAHPQTSVTILFRDLYLQGEDSYEDLVREARRVGIAFMRFEPPLPPRVTDETVEVHDVLTGNVCRLPYDRVVLATPLVPQPDASVLAHMLGIDQDDAGFFPEAAYRLRPQDYVDRGIYVCGAAHRPCDTTEAEFQGVSSAFRALRHLHAGTVISRAPVATIDETVCTGCGSCVETCPFGAISMCKREGVLDRSQIDPLLCKGCSNCVVACPVKAISQPLDDDSRMLAQIEAALTSESRDGRPRILVFGCEWSSHAAAELAGANKLKYPTEVRLIRVRCSARFDPSHILWAFFCGANGVFLGACRPGECHYVNGNRYAQERIGTLRGLLSESGFDPRRLSLEWITADDPHDFVAKISDFAHLVQALGPSPALMLLKPMSA